MTDQTAKTSPAGEFDGTTAPADPGPAEERPAEERPAEDVPTDEATPDEAATDDDPAAAEPGPEQQDTLIEVPKTDDIPGALEALLLLAEEPMSETVLAQAVGAPVHVVSEALAELVAFYDETGRGFELRQLGGGWRYYTRAEHADLIAGHVLDGAQSRLSQAALETLAVIAYLQPISRSRVSAIRGVNVDGVIRTLLARGLIVEAGADAESGAVVFATTDYFLERMGLSSLEQLPELAPHLPEASELEAELSQFATISQTADADGAVPLADESPEPASSASSPESPASADSPDSPDSPASPSSPDTPTEPEGTDEPSSTEPDSDESESDGSEAEDREAADRTFDPADSDGPEAEPAADAEALSADDQEPDDGGADAPNHGGPDADAAEAAEPASEASVPTEPTRADAAEVSEFAPAPEAGSAEPGPGPAADPVPASDSGSVPLAGSDPAPVAGPDALPTTDSDPTSASDADSPAGDADSPATDSGPARAADSPVSGDPATGQDAPDE